MGALDIVIILLLIMFAVVGWKQGIIKEVVQLVGMIIILVLSFNFKDELGNIEVYASIYHPEDNSGRLEAIETEKEWKVIETILESIQSEGKKDNKEEA